MTVSLCVQVQHPGDCDGGDGLRQDAAGQVSLCSADSQTERHQHHGARQGEDDRLQASLSRLQIWCGMKMPYGNDFLFLEVI